MQILHISTISMLSFSMYTLALPAPHPEAPAGSVTDVLDFPSNEKTLAAIPETKSELGPGKLGLDVKKDETKPGLEENELKKKDAKDAKGLLGDAKAPGAAPGEIPEQCRQYIKGAVESPPKPPTPTKESLPKPTEPKTPPTVTQPKPTPPADHEPPKKLSGPPTKTSSAVSGKIQGTQAVFTTALSSSVLVYAIAAVFL